MTSVRPRGATRPAPPGRVPTWLLLLVVAAVGVNARATFGAAPPLIDHIGEDLRLNATAQSLLTAVPVLGMGLFAPLGSRLGVRLGQEVAAGALLGVLAVGGLLRLAVHDVATLLGSTVVVGAGIGGVSALMPGLIAYHLPRLPGTATGVYSIAMAGGIALAAALAAPSARAFGGWRPALALWGAVAAVTALVWFALVPRLRDGTARRRAATATGSRGLPWRSRTAWWVTGYTTANMVLGYGGIAWFAPTFVHHGFSTSAAATMFVLFEVVQFAAMLVLPPLTDVVRDRRPLLAVAGLATCLGMAALVAAPAALAVPAMLLCGFGIGGTASLALVLIQDATDDRAEASRLGAMVLLVSCAAGAAGPLLMGGLRDATGGFTAGYVTLLVVSLAGMLMLPAFRPGRSIHDLAGTAGSGRRSARDAA